MIRKVGLVAALAAAVLVATLPAGGVAATQSQVSIETNAQFAGGGGAVILQLHVRCDAGFGFVNAQVSQSPPENTSPTQGNGGAQVVCDGQQHQSGVFVFSNGPPFDIGKAYAFVTLGVPNQPFPAATAAKTINVTF